MESDMREATGIYATEPDIDENCTKDCTDGSSIDPQYVADRERDIRMCCLRTAMETYRTGEADAEIILRTAELFHNFVNGVNLPATVQS